MKKAGGFLAGLVLTVVASFGLFAPATMAATSPYYVNTSKVMVKRPAAAVVIPVGATAQCKDNTYSFSKTRRGTCSHHGGVKKWL